MVEIFSVHWRLDGTSGACDERHQIIFGDITLVVPNLARGEVSTECE